jgi:hypothetical protein
MAQGPNGTTGAERFLPKLLQCAGKISHKFSEQRAATADRRAPEAAA